MYRTGNYNTLASTCGNSTACLASKREAPVAPFPLYHMQLTVNFSHEFLIPIPGKFMVGAVVVFYIAAYDLYKP